MYDMENNTVNLLNDFPSPTNAPFGFSINGKAYVGGGYNNVGGYNPLIEFWEYDLESDEWIRKNDLPSNGFIGSTSFVIDGKAYLTEMVYQTQTTRLWCYDPETDSWENKSPIPNSNKRLASGFTINGLGYVACGSSGFFYTDPVNDLWEYNPANDQWTRKHNFPGYSYSGGVCFVLNDMAYLGAGRPDYTNVVRMFYQYDPSLDN
jgi:N-acetylneuraminic acid mutarotase